MTNPIVRVTHTDYMHANHLRGIDDKGNVLCISPNSEAYRKFNRSNLPKYTGKEIQS